MPMANYDVAAVRAAFPALRSGAAHFDGPGGTQVPEPVATVRPGVLGGEAAGAPVRWLPFAPATGELADVSTVLSGRTRRVAVTGASNLIGTRPPVERIAARVHDTDALLAVDGVHL